MSNEKAVKLRDIVGVKAAGKDPDLAMMCIGTNLWAAKDPKSPRLRAKLATGYGQWKLEKYSGDRTTTILSSGKWTVSIGDKVIESGFWK